MKTFRMIGATLCALIACIAMSACSNENGNAPIGNEEPDSYIVKLGMAGEILDITEEPLTRAAGDDLYGIQVYSCPANTETTTWTYYAYGLFDDIEDIEIKLLNGYKYKFVATMVVDGKNKIRNNEGGEYNRPFEHVSGSLSAFTAISNKFDYQSNSYFYNLDKGYSVLKDGAYTLPNTERYYGELCDYVPEEGKTASINMKRVSFGAKFVAQGKFKQGGGYITINIANAPTMQINADGDQFVQDIFTYEDLIEAYQAEKDNDYSKAISVNLSWTKGDGAVIPFGTHEINFRRNKLTVVTIKVDDKSSANALGCEIDENELGEMETGDEKTVEDGKVTDTTVTPEAN